MLLLKTFNADLVIETFNNVALKMKLSKSTNEPRERSQVLLETPE